MISGLKLLFFISGTDGTGFAVSLANALSASSKLMIFALVMLTFNNLLLNLRLEVELLLLSVELAFSWNPVGIAELDFTEEIEFCDIESLNRDVRKLSRFRFMFDIDMILSLL